MKRDWRVEEFNTMVTIGPSITAGGWSTCPERCWASLLAALINDFQSKPVKLFNMGIGANVISTRSAAYPYSSKPAGSERLDEQVIANRPDLVIIGEFAVNDARGGTPLHVFKEELVAMVCRLRTAIDPVIVLLGPTYILDFQIGGEVWSHADLQVFKDYNKLTAEVACSQDCLYVDIMAAIGETDWMVHYDGVHINDLGHRVIAGDIFKYLAQNCSCLAKRTKELEKSSPRWRDESCLMEHIAEISER